MLGDLVELISEEPLTRAQILTELTARGHPAFEAGPVNVLMPWVAYQGLAVGDADGRWLASEPPAPVDADEALATLAERYLAGYGPATAGDLARWSGLPLGTARRALDAAEPPEPGDPPEPAAAQLLGGFDTVMLGYESREPVAGRASTTGGSCRAAASSRPWCSRTDGRWERGS